MAHHRPALIYAMNDLYHFFLNLVFLQVSGLELGPQYNNPSWSVAVEVFVYVIFFNLARASATRYVASSLGLVLLGMSVYRMQWTFPFVNEYTSRGVMGFFLGSLLFLGLRRAEQRGLATRVGVAALLALVGVAAVAKWVGYDAFVVGSSAPGGRIVPPHVLVIFPLILTVALTLAPVRKVLAVRPLRFVGDISFTVYLLHVPLQMAMLAAFEWRGAKLPTSDARFFWGFLATTLVLATVTHHYMEVPARRLIRRRFLDTAM
jgi:peptidoglycan/LPS O-acetylase OafA/YrhL